MLTNAQDPQGQVQRRQGQVPIQVEVEKKHLQPQEGLMNEDSNIPHHLVALYFAPNQHNVLTIMTHMHRHDITHTPFGFTEFSGSRKWAFAVP
jgi:hypothetical protein